MGLVWQACKMPKTRKNKNNVANTRNDSESCSINEDVQMSEGQDDDQDSTDTPDRIHQSSSDEIGRAHV